MVLVSEGQISKLGLSRGVHPRKRVKLHTQRAGVHPSVQKLGP